MRGGKPPGFHVSYRSSLIWMREMFFFPRLMQESLVQYKSTLGKRRFSDTLLSAKKQLFMNCTKYNWRKNLCLNRRMDVEAQCCRCLCLRGNTLELAVLVLLTWLSGAHPGDAGGLICQPRFLVGASFGLRSLVCSLSRDNRGEMGSVCSSWSASGAGEAAGALQPEVVAVPESPVCSWMYLRLS